VRNVARELVAVARMLAGRKAPYHSVIAPILKRMGRDDVDPRHVEAYLRMESETGTLDSKSRSWFARIIPEIVETIDADPRMAERLADSYGL